jgi:adenine-specific DNA-methyltransferase
MGNEMKNVELEDGQSADIVSENILKMKELFPDAFSEAGVNFDTLRQLLGDASVLDEGEEKYGLSWHGKKKARQIALTPSTGTLLPRPHESLDWGTTKNLFIEGDNLEVLKLLKKSYANKVKMIYIDPPYNTGKEFIYPDNFSDNLNTYLKYTGQVDDEGAKFSSNTEAGGRKHTNWLNMIYPRLKVAHSLLKADGAVFVSIDDNEVDKLRMVLDEIFGGENFVATVIWQKVYAPKNTAQYFSEDHDYIIIYAKNKALWRPSLLERTAEQDALYKNPDNDPRGVWMSDNLTARNHYGDGTYEIEGPTGKKFSAGKGRYWRSSIEKIRELDADGRIWWGASGDGMPRLKRFLTEVSSGRVPQTFWPYKEVGHTQDAKRELIKYVSFEETENVLNSVKPVALIKRAIKIGTVVGEEDLILDFFAGSGPTAQATLEANSEDGGNRRYILIQLQEPLKKEEDKLKTIADLAKSRISNFERENQSNSGFKLFSLSNSSIQVWNPDRTDIEESLLSHEEHLVEGRTEQDVLYELLLKRGVDLAAPIETREVVGKNIYSIGYGVLFACLDESITKEQVEDIAQAIITWHGELDPSSDTHVFFRDSAFRDDVSKTNMAAILEQNGITHVRSL